MAADAALFDVHLDDANGALVLWRGTILLQTRRGELDPRSITIGQRLMVRSEKAGRVVALLAVLEPGSPIPSAELRQRQREAIEVCARYERSRIAAIMLGDDTMASLVRSAGRLVGVGSPRIQRFDTVRAGVSWLAQELTALSIREPTACERVRAIDLLDALEHVRRMTARHPSVG